MYYHAQIEMNKIRREDPSKFWESPNFERYRKMYVLAGRISNVWIDDSIDGFWIYWNRYFPFEVIGRGETTYSADEPPWSPSQRRFISFIGDSKDDFDAYEDSASERLGYSPEHLE